METVKDYWLPGLGGREGWTVVAQRIFRAATHAILHW
jgi:hypothetical protein